MSPVRRVRRVTADPDDRSERHLGQATVEFVLMLPLLLLLTLAIVQVGLLVRTRVLVTHAAREAVREAAVGGSRDRKSTRLNSSH